MAKEQTLSIIKPNAVSKNVVGDICNRFEQAGLAIIAMRMLRMDEQIAGDFYAEHRGKGFWGELLDFMTSGPLIVLVLEGENAIARNRELMGATNPEKAAAGTIRKDHADSLTENAVHGSDSLESAEREIRFFFQPNEIFAR